MKIQTHPLGRALGRVDPRFLSAYRWSRVFWPLIAVIIAGITAFSGPIAASIASTPHPELVYAIFGVAALATLLFGLSLNHFLREHAWFARLASADSPTLAAMIAARREHDALTPVYRVLDQTRGFPLSVRQPAMDQELHAAEGELLARLALPNLLSGSLVGLGLVGTFIGLLQTLDELSGVFAALGGGSGGGDPSSMFSTMIVRLQGPMQGMGTAFVASLYGLLGSLIIGIVGGGVRRAVERLMADVRLFVTTDLMAHRATGAPSPAGGTSATHGNGGAQYEGLLEVVRSEQAMLREMLAKVGEIFEDRLDRLVGTAASLNLRLVDTVDDLRQQAAAGAEKLEEARLSGERVAIRVEASSFQLTERAEALRQDLRVASEKGILMFGRAAMGLSIGGAFAVLLAVAGLQFGSFERDMRPGRDTATNGSGKPVSPPKAPADRAPSGSGAPREKVASTEPEQEQPLVTVQTGDTLDEIARRNGRDVAQIILANPQIADPARIDVGDKVKLPPAGQSNRKPI